MNAQQFLWGSFYTTKERYLTMNEDKKIDHSKKELIQSIQVLSLSMEPLLMETWKFYSS